MINTVMYAALLFVGTLTAFVGASFLAATGEFVVRAFLENTQYLTLWLSTLSGVVLLGFAAVVFWLALKMKPT